MNVTGGRDVKEEGGYLISSSTSPFPGLERFLSFLFLLLLLFFFSLSLFLSNRSMTATSTTLSAAHIHFIQAQNPRRRHTPTPTLWETVTFSTSFECSATRWPLCTLLYTFRERKKQTKQNKNKSELNFFFPLMDREGNLEPEHPENKIIHLNKQILEMKCMWTVVLLLTYGQAFRRLPLKVIRKTR